LFLPCNVITPWDECTVYTEGLMSLAMAPFKRSKIPTRVTFDSVFQWFVNVF